MKRLALACIAGIVVVACATPAILIADPKDYPCGVHGISCGDKTCCDEGDVCGGQPFSGCPAGMCCFVGPDDGRVAARKPTPQKGVVPGPMR